MKLTSHSSIRRQDSHRLALRWSLALVICVYLVYSTSLALFSVPSFPTQTENDVGMPFLSDQPIGEDAFYMLTVSWAIAKGDGIRYNGKRTTGIQPLATFVYAILARINQARGWSKWTFLRLVLIFGAATLLIFAEQVHQIAGHLLNNGEDDSTLRLVAYALTLTNFGLFRAFTYGLETGLYLCLIAWIVLFTLRQRWPIDVPNALKLGGMTGVAGLARIDFIIVAGVFLAFAYRAGMARLRHVFAAGATLSAIVVPWLVFVHRVTGHWMPSSGGAQFRVVSYSEAGYRTWQMFKGVVDHLTPWVYTAQLDGLTVLAVATLVAAGAAARWIRRRERMDTPKSFRHWAIGTATLILLYPALFWSTHFYARYITPVSVCLLPWMTARVATMVPRRTLWPIAVGAVCVLTFVLGALVSLHSGRFVGPHAIAAGFVQANFDPRVRVGALQSGVIGFFHENTVNLDGKMDDEALEALLSDEVGRYIDSENVTVLVEWKSILEDVLSREYMASWRECPGVISNDRSVCLTRPSAIPP